MILHRFQRNRGTVQRPARLALLALMLAGSFTAQASVVITGTRVVYPANQKEVTVRFENKNPKPALVQVWLDSGNEDATPEEARVPFLATPPIFRMEPGRQQVLRLSYTGEPLPTNQESLFWLNMLEVPQGPGQRAGEPAAAGLPDPHQGVLPTAGPAAGALPGRRQAALGAGP